MTDATHNPLYEVTFQPFGRRGSASAHEDLLTVARRSGVEIETACGGKGSCGKCRVQITPPAGGVAGAAATDAAAGPVSPPTDAERRLLGDALLATGLRLACQTRVLSDLSVFVPEESRRAGRVGTKQPRVRLREVDPAVRTYPIGLQPSASGAALVAALAEQHGVPQLAAGVEVARAASRLVEQGHVDLVAVVWQGARAGARAHAGAAVTEAHPGAAGDAAAPGEAEVLEVFAAAEPRRTLGLALDVGTTTIAAYLADLATGEILATESALNPQVAFGDDIIARMQYAAHQPGGGLELQQLAIAEVDRLARHAAERSSTQVEDIFDVVMVGNTAIHHLFMGLDTDSLRRAPFEPAVRAAINTQASAVGLAFHPQCRLYALPNEAGFVGADNVAVIIAEEPYNQDEAMLIIDVGTNGELVLGDRRRMLSASCATGPAFEGAHIEHGMRATPGAIERVRIEPKTLEVSFKTIGTDAWSTDLPDDQVQARGICGSGVIEAAAEMLKAGVILPDGGFDPHLSHERVLLEDGRPRRLVIARAEQSATGRAITVSLHDIRAIQLGKAALRAGAEILLGLYGAQKPDRVVLAGAFGSYIDKHAALAIGMLPACEPDKVTSVGNAAGDGALLALLSVGKRREAEWVAQTVQYVELASAPDFQERYIKALRFEPPDAGRQMPPRA